MVIPRNTLCILALALVASQTAAQEFKCTDALRAINENHPYEGDCNKFYHCGRPGKTLLWGCGPNKVFDPTTRLCVAGNKCIKTAFQCPVGLVGQAFFPDPENCKMLFDCRDSNPTPLHYACEPNKVFDPTTRMCVPGNECIKQKEPFQCPVGLIGQAFFPDPENCKMLFDCRDSNPTPLHYACAHDQVFDPKMNLCVAPEHAPHACKKTTKKCIPRRKRS